MITSKGPNESTEMGEGGVFVPLCSGNGDRLQIDLSRLEEAYVCSTGVVGFVNSYASCDPSSLRGGLYFATSFGDVAFRILKTINDVERRALRDHDNNAPEETQIFVCDINSNMLTVGKKRAQERGFGEDKSLIWVEGDAEALKFENNLMNAYTIAFGNKNATHIEKARTEAFRVLKWGGRFPCLELSHVEIPVFKELYDFYSFSVIPVIGELVVGDRESYQYLVESICCSPLR